MKTCRRCACTKPLASFYRHPGMADGYLNHCKDCVTERVRAHRQRHVERLREYDRSRSRQEQRRADHRARSLKQRRLPPPVSPTRRLQRRAHSALWNALRAGKVERQSSCCVCGATAKVEAHHEDYRRPLDVSWLCSRCHGDRHREINELIRSGVDLSERGL